MAGLWNLIKLILRRDRVKLPLFVFLFVGIMLYMVPILRETYGDAAGLRTIYNLFETMPSVLLLTGPMDAPTFGGLFTFETVLWWGLVLAFFNTVFVVRHTRANEENGAEELMLSGRVSRFSPLVAALVVSLAANLVIAVLTTVGLLMLDTGWGFGNSALYGLAFGVFGFTWAAIAALVVQLVASARTANGLLAGLIGLTFLLRGIGDFMGVKNAAGILEPTFISNLTPFGWLEATRSLTFPEWSPLFVSLAFVVGAVVVSLAFLSKRDLGAGILPSRKGRTRASKFRRTALGLTVYLQKNVFVGWLVGCLALVGVIGMLANDKLTTVYSGSEAAKATIEAMGGQGDFVGAFLTAMLKIVVIMVLAYVIQAMVKLRSEEASGHLENVLAGRLSRTGWLLRHFVVVMLASALMLGLSGAVLALVANFSSDLGLNVGEYILGALSYWPLMLAVAGAYVMLFGLLPRLSGAVLWTIYSFVAFMSWLGPLMKIDQKIIDLSPLEHFAPAPAESVAMAPLLTVSAVGLVLVIFGLIFWRQRNLTPQ